MILSVYYLDKALSLSDEKNAQQILNDFNGEIIQINKGTSFSEIDKLITKWLKEHKNKHTCLIFRDTEILLSFLTMYLAHRFELMYAAGGLIEHPQKGYLFIFKGNYWDLPKGKIDKKEKIQDAAIRECQEETGIDLLSIKENLGVTYHIFHQKNKWILKITQWYFMESTSNKELIPQKEEGIEKVIWINKDSIFKIIVPQTFPSIIDVLKRKGLLST